MRIIEIAYSDAMNQLPILLIVFRLGALLQSLEDMFSFQRTMIACHQWYSWANNPIDANMSKLKVYACLTWAPSWSLLAIQFGQKSEKSVLDTT